MTVKELLEKLDYIKQKISKLRAKRIDIPLIIKIIKRLDSFSNECEECKYILSKFGELIEKLTENDDKELDKQLMSLIQDASNHLKKVHNLVPENHYSNMYMTYGLALGLSFGVIFSQIINQDALIGIGLPLGMSIGLLIGSEKDKKAKKEGMQI